jgi:hypothetical protein
VERRVCFTLEDLAPAAPAFDYLCACVGGRRPPGAAAAPGAAGFRLGAGAAEAAVAGPGGSGHTAGVSGSALSQHASDGAACAPGGRGESAMVLGRKGRAVLRRRPRRRQAGGRPGLAASVAA